MKTAKIFTPSDDEIKKLIRNYPLAYVCSTSDEGLIATPLPLMYREERGAPYLLGHFARANPQVRALQKNPQALVIFNGPHGYISPSWFRDRSQAPTWNYMTCHFLVEILFNDTEESARQAVDDLTLFMEDGRPNSWHSGELGERYDRLIKAVIPFRVEIKEVRSKFKLGQNERDDVFEDALEGLKKESKNQLYEEMKVRRVK